MLRYRRRGSTTRYGPAVDRTPLAAHYHQPLHRRLRYVLFIHSMYSEVDSWGGGYDVAYEAWRMGMCLIDGLAGSDDHRHSGAGVAGGACEQLPGLRERRQRVLRVCYG